MKQYAKDRSPAIMLFYCCGKAPCQESSYCMKECWLTSRKNFARKDASGKPVKDGRFLPARR